MCKIRNLRYNLSFYVSPTDFISITFFWSTLSETYEINRNHNQLLRPHKNYAITLVSNLISFFSELVFSFFIFFLVNTRNGYSWLSKIAHFNIFFSFEGIFFI
jgi:hypothetical protein